MVREHVRKPGHLTVGTLGPTVKPCGTVEDFEVDGNLDATVNRHMRGRIIQKHCTCNLNS